YWVVCYPTLTKNYHTLMLFHWHIFYRPEVGTPILRPNPLCFEVLDITHYEIRSEGLACGENNRAALLYNSIIMLPQSIQRDYGVPLVRGHSIRQVAQDHINALIRNIRHSHQTILVINRI